MGEFVHWYLTREGWIREPRNGGQPPNAVALYRFERWGRDGLRNELRPMGQLIPEGAEVERLLRMWGPCPRHL